MATQYGKLVNKQFNSPINLYSETNIREVLDRETQLLENGAVGINFHNPTTAKTANLQNSAVLRFLEEEEHQRKRAVSPTLKRVAWPPPSEGEGHLAEVTAQDLSGPQISSPGLQNHQAPSANYQQPVQERPQLANQHNSVVVAPSYNPTPQQTAPLSPFYQSTPHSPSSNPSGFSAGQTAKQWAPVQSPKAVSPQPKFPTSAPELQYNNYQAAPQQYQPPFQQYQAPTQQYQPPPQQYQPQTQQYSYQPPTQVYQYTQEPQQYQPPPQAIYHPPQQSQTTQTYSQPSTPQQIIAQPQYQAPATAPQLAQQQQQQQHQQRQTYAPVASTPTHQPTAVYQPPKQTKVVEPPPSTITLRPQAPVSQAPAPLITSQPATATLKGGKNLRGDLKWPPPETKALIEAENQARMELARGPVCRPRKVKRDYTGFFAQHALNNTYPGYKVPPGTQFYLHENAY